MLDLNDFAGGLTPTETGGGMQTRALRFMGANGREYSFRPVYKALLDLPDTFRGTLVWSLIMDARSASHPTAPVSAPPVVAAAGLLQAPAALVAMPDDPKLGQFRQEFGGVLGTIEERPKVPDNNPSAAFAGAENIEDGEDMLERINEEPQKINARDFLKAVLVDALLNDNDRHAASGAGRDSRRAAPGSNSARSLQGFHRLRRIPCWFRAAALRLRSFVLVRHTRGSRTFSTTELSSSAGC